MSPISKGLSSEVSVFGGKGRGGKMCVFVCMCGVCVHACVVY